MIRFTIIAASLIVCSADVSAQHRSGHQHQAHQHAPYAGMQNREIKALSQEQLEDLKAGKGMSLALPAELNGYPGPAHVLELADKLKLSADQNKRMQELFNAMSQEAKKLGLEVIEAERALDTLFKNKSVTRQNLAQATQNAGQAQARLREAHLRYHLSTIELLTKDQVDAYNRLRGY